MAQKIKPRWLLCKRCIGAIRSRGEQIYVGAIVEQDDDEKKCDWCEEVNDELYECI